MNRKSFCSNKESISKNKNKFNTISKSNTPNTYFMKLNKQRINTTRESPIYIRTNNFGFKGNKPSSISI